MQCSKSSVIAKTYVLFNFKLYRKPAYVGDCNRSASSMRRRVVSRVVIV